MSADEMTPALPIDNARATTIRPHSSLLCVKLLLPERRHIFATSSFIIPCLTLSVCCLSCVLFEQIRNHSTPARSREKKTAGKKARTPATQPPTPATPSSASSAVSGICLLSTFLSRYSLYPDASSYLLRTVVCACESYRHLEVPGEVREQLHANKHSLCRSMPLMR